MISYLDIVIYKGKKYLVVAGVGEDKLDIQLLGDGTNSILTVAKTQVQLVKSFHSPDYDL